MYNIIARRSRELRSKACAWMEIMISIKKKKKRGFVAMFFESL